MYVEDDLHTDRPQADRPIVPKPIVPKLTIREMYVEDEQLGDGWHIVGTERDGTLVPILQACGSCWKEGSTSRIDVKAGHSVTKDCGSLTNVRPLLVHVPRHATRGQRSGPNAVLFVDAVDEGIGTSEYRNGCEGNGQNWRGTRSEEFCFLTRWD